MKRISVGVFVIVALVLAFVAGGYAATKSYQFTGVVKSVEGSTFSVEKSAKETWTFETSKDTKGTPKAGEKVTVSYKMVATDIENRPSTPTKPAPPRKK
jgi:hypothetical protein